MPVTNFQSVVSAQSVGTADVQKLAESFDKLSGSIDGASKKADALNQHQGFGSFADKVRQGIENPLQGISTAATAALNSLGAVSGAVTLAGGAFAGAAAGIFAATKSLGEWGIQIKALEERTGFTAKQVGEFSFAARAAGQDVSVFERMMRGLTVAIEDNSEKGNKAREWLGRFHVDIAAVRDGTADTAKVLQQVADGLNKLPGTFERNKAALDLFKRSGVEAIPVLLQLSQNLKTAQQQGFGFSDADVEKFARYQKVVTEIEFSWEKVGRAIKKAFAEAPIGFAGGIGAGALARAYDAAHPFPDGFSEGQSESRRQHYQAVHQDQLDRELDSRVATHVLQLNQRLQLSREAQGKILELQLRSSDDAAKAFGSDTGILGRYDAEIGTIQNEQSHFADFARNYGFGLSKSQSDQANLAFGVRQFAAYIAFTHAWNKEVKEIGDRAPEVFETRDENGQRFVGDPLLRRQIEESFRFAESSTLLRGSVGVPLPNGYVSPEQQLRDSRNRSTRGLGLYSLQANLQGTPEAIQAATLFDLKQKYADEEYAALVRIADLKKTEDEKARARQDALDEREQRRFEAQLERDEALYQVAIHQKEQADSFSGALFDALHSRTTNRFFRDFAVGQERQLFTNFASPIVGNATRLLGSLIPGQVDANGSPTLLGSLLHGTVLDSANADPARQTALNTRSTVSLLTDIRSLLSGGRYSPANPAGTGTPGFFGPPNVFGSVGSFGEPGGFSGLSDLPGTSGAFSSVFQPGYAGFSNAGNPSIFAQFTSGFGAGGSNPLAAIATGQATGPGWGANLSAAQRAGVAVGTAAMLAGAGLTIASGISQGGVGGFTKAASAGLGAAAALDPEPVSKLILGSVAAVTGIVGALFGTGPEQRAKNIANALQSNQYLAPTALNVTQGPGGTYEDFDARGNLRTSNFRALPVVAEPYITSRVIDGSRTYYDVPGYQTAPFTSGPAGTGAVPVANTPAPIQVTIQAMDAESFHDFAQRNAGAIGASVLAHLTGGGGGRLAAEIHRQLPIG